jgi:uncharacterized protein (TIRG00374 family)
MKRLLSLLVSVTLLGLIYAHLDPHAILDAMRACDPVWLASSLAMVVPLTLLTAWRFRQLVPQPERLPLVDATRLTLAASTLNLILPSKMGDIAKAFFLASRGDFSRSQSFALVIFEKTFDMLSLLLWCLLSLLVIPGLAPLPVTGFILVCILVLCAMLWSAGFLKVAEKSFTKIAPAVTQGKFSRLFEAAHELQLILRRNPQRSLFIALQSLLLWFLHLMQIGGFTWALGARIPLLSQMAFASLSILAGLLPFTFAGVGTRDAAAIALYAGYLSPQSGAVLGLLMTSRYLMPGLAGIPFLGTYAAMARTRAA